MAEPAESDEELLPRLAEVVDAALGVGAAAARTVAQATTSRPLPAVGEEHLQDMARFGATAVGNVLGMIVDASRAGVRSPAAKSAAPGMDGNAPTVSAGSTLRVPLLVENPSATPTVEVSFRLAHVEGLDGQGPDGIAEVTFTPPSLVLAARDFEKLTVRILTRPDASPGRYRVTVEGGDGWFSTVIELTVLSD